MSSPVPWGDAKARIIAANLGVPIAWPNEPFQKPASGLWMSVQSTSGMLDPIELPGIVWQEDGTLYIDVMAPVGSSSDAARTLAKNAANVFRAVTGNPAYLGGSIGNGAVTEPDGMWWCLTVTIDWRYQDST